MANAQLKIKSTFQNTQALQGIAQQHKALTGINQDIVKIFKSEKELLNFKKGVSPFKNWSEDLNKAKKSLSDVAKQSKQQHQALSKGLEGFSSGGLSGFGAGLAGGLVGSLAFNIIKQIGGMVVGAYAGLGRFIIKAIEAGEGDREIAARLRLDLGKGLGDYVTNLSNKLGDKAAIGGSDAANILLPIAQSIQQSIKKGARVLDATGKTIAIKTDAQAEQFQRQILDGLEKQLETAVIVGSRNKTSAQDVSNALLKFALDPSSGLKPLVGALGVEGRKPQIEALIKANEKGTLADEIGADNAKRLGVKSGQRVGNNKLLEVVFDRLGLENHAREIEKSFSYQWKKIQKIGDDVLGDLGTQILNNLLPGTNGIQDLSTTLKDFVNSKEGQTLIKDLGKSLADIAKEAFNLARHLPALLHGINKVFELWVKAINIGNKLSLSGIRARLDGSAAKSEAEDKIANEAAKAKETLEKTTFKPADNTFGPVTEAEYKRQAVQATQVNLAPIVQVAAGAKLSSEEFRQMLERQAPELIDLLVTQFNKANPNN